MILILFNDDAIAIVNVHSGNYTETFQDSDKIQGFIDLGWIIPEKLNHINKEIIFIKKDKNTNNQSIAVSSNGNSKVSLISPEIIINGSEIVEASIKISVQSISKGKKQWHVPRAQLQILDTNRKVIKTITIGSLYDADSWVQFSSKIIIPFEGRSLRWILSMNHSSGYVYFDDLLVKVITKKSDATNILTNSSDPDNIYNSIVIPVPHMVSLTNEFVTINDAAIDFSQLDLALKNDLSSLIKNIHNNRKIHKNVNKKSSINLVIKSLDINNDNIKDILLSKPQSILKILDKNQSYLIDLKMIESNTLVVSLVSGSDVGRYYAFQTFKQLLNYHNNEIKLPLGFIVDFPQFKYRGVVFGGFERWDKKYSFGNNQMFSIKDWMSYLKLNFVWLAGWNGLYNRTLFPINESDKLKLLEFYKDCKEMYVTASIGLRPYKQKSTHKRPLGGVSYSSDEDIASVIDNLNEFYKIGFRDFHISFDDQLYSDVLKYDQDSMRFTDPGEAHKHFIEIIYDKFISIKKDVKLRVIAIPYHGIYSKQDLLYMKHMSKLPKDIEFIWVGDSLESAKNYIEYAGDRKLMIWSNFYPNNNKSLKNTRQLLAHSFYSDLELQNVVDSIIFHPLIKRNSADTAISWYTVSDYMWRGLEYNSIESYKLSIIKLLGKTSYDDLVSIDFNENIYNIISKLKLDTDDGILDTESKKIYVRELLDKCVRYGSCMEPVTK